MSLETVTVTLPDFWASALINGDESGLEDSDIAKMERVLARLGLAAGHCLTCGEDEPSFMRWHDAAPDVLACNCLEYTFATYP